MKWHTVAAPLGIAPNTTNLIYSVCIMIQLVEVVVLSFIFQVAGVTLRKKEGSPAPFKPSVGQRGPHAPPPPQNNREVAARLIGELERMLGPNQLPKTRGPKAQPIAFSIEAMRHAEAQEDDAEDIEEPDVTPECIALRKTHTWLQILKTELNTSWPGWLDQFNDMREELRSAHLVYAPVVTALQAAQQEIVKCIDSGGAGCEHPTLRDISANVVTPNGSNETAAQHYTNESQKLLNFTGARVQSALNVKMLLENVTGEGEQITVPKDSFGAIMQERKLGFMNRLKQLDEVKTKRCPEIRPVKLETVCDETLRSFQETRTNFQSYYKSTMGQLTEADRRLQKIQTGKGDECPFEAAMLDRLQALSSTCGPIDEATKKLQLFLREWADWRKYGPQFAAHLRRLNHKIASSLAAMEQAQGLAGVVTTNDTTRTKFLLDGTSVNVEKLNVALQSFVLSVAPNSYQVASTVHQALSLLFEQKQQLGCLDYEVQRRMAGPTGCGGMLEWYQKEKTSLASEMEEKAVEFATDLRSLKVRAWKYKCGAASDLPPEEEGCYALTPAGCPSKPESALPVWTRDVEGEAEYKKTHFGNDITKFECLVSRQVAYAQRCGTVNVKMHYGPPLPVSKGCWAYLPSGCKKEPDLQGLPIRFTRDVTGEQEDNAYLDEQACLVTRKQRWDTYCDVDNTRVMYVEDTIDPPSPGCWYHMPFGCPRAPEPPELAFDVWQRDVLGNMTDNADSNETACIHVRQQAWNILCGAEVMVQWVPPRANSTLVKMQLFNATGNASAVMQTLDDNTDGVVSEEEFVAHAAQMGLHPKQAEDVFNEMDTSGNGGLTLCVSPSDLNITQHNSTGIQSQYPICSTGGVYPQNLTTKELAHLINATWPPVNQSVAPPAPAPPAVALVTAQIQNHNRHLRVSH